MNNITLAKNEEKIIKKEAFSFSWKDSPSIQHLLDVISSILVEEYITIAKQNPEVFSKIASPPSRVSNDTQGNEIHNDKL